MGFGRGPPEGGGADAEPADDGRGGGGVAGPRPGVVWPERGPPRGGAFNPEAGRTGEGAAGGPSVAGLAARTGADGGCVVARAGPAFPCEADVAGATEAEVGPGAGAVVGAAGVGAALGRSGAEVGWIGGVSETLVEGDREEGWEEVTDGGVGEGGAEPPLARLLIWSTVAESRLARALGLTSRPHFWMRSSSSGLLRPSSLANSWTRVDKGDSSCDGHGRPRVGAGRTESVL